MNEAIQMGAQWSALFLFTNCIALVCLVFSGSLLI